MSANRLFVMDRRPFSLLRDCRISGRFRTGSSNRLQENGLAMSQQKPPSSVAGARVAHRLLGGLLGPPPYCVHHWFSKNGNGMSLSATWKTIGIALARPFGDPSEDEGLSVPTSEAVFFLAKGRQY